MINSNIREHIIGLDNKHHITHDREDFQNKH